MQKVIMKSTLYFQHANIKLKINIVFGILILVLAITCVDENMCLWSLMNQWVKMFPLEIILNNGEKEKCKIPICLKDGRHQFISNVYYIPIMKTNILSLDQLLEKGYDIHLKNYSLFIRDDSNNMIEKVPMSRNRMFMLNIQNDIAKYLKACYKDLWIFHLNFGGLELLSKCVKLNNSKSP